MVKALLADEHVAVSRMRTAENAENLAGGFMAAVERRYAGTRLGRQELDGELLEDIEGALWTRALVERLTQVPGVSRAFNRPVFHEAVLKLPRPASAVLEELLARGILGGFDLSIEYPELGNALLVCATETREEADLQQYAAALARIV